MVAELPTSAAHKIDKQQRLSVVSFWVRADGPSGFAAKADPKCASRAMLRMGRSFVALGCLPSVRFSAASNQLKISLGKIKFPELHVSENNCFLWRPRDLSLANPTVQPIVVP